MKTKVVKSSKVEFYEFNTNTLLTLEDMEKVFSKVELHLQSQGEADYPSLNGVQAKTY